MSERMKRLFVFFLLVLWGCSQESAVDSAKSSTFVRYFNGSFEDEAQALLETADKGLVIMANTNFDGFNRVNLIKTDEFGNLLWQRFYPDPQTTTTTSYSGYGISLTPAGGYVIVGEAIKSTSARLLIITTDAEGNTPVIKPMDNLSTRKGISVAVNPAGNFLVVSSVSSEPSVNLILSEFSNTSLEPTWTRMYGAGALTENSLPNKLFTDAQGAAYWGGTVLKANQKSSMRFIKTPPNSPNVLFDLTLGKPTDTEFSGDMIRYGNNFAFIGTSQTGIDTETNSITVRRVTESGTQIFSRGYQIIDSKELLTGEITGNSLSVAQDGGLVLLGTIGIGPPGTISTNTNYCLIKIDGFGNTKAVWTKIIGGRFNENGKAIITTRDGGHVILGTTNLANVNTLLLMKVDKDGNIPGL
jgi:hypothetical protein